MPHATQTSLFEPATAAAPDLASYDWLAVASSAGKDSQTALDETVRQADAAGVPRERIVVIHCALGRVEWQGTPELAAEQAAHYGLRYIETTRPQGDLLDQVKERGMWPSPAVRFCTSDHKRGQIWRVFTKLADETRAARPSSSAPVRILAVDGRRADESPKRAKLSPFGFNPKASNGRRHVDDWLPIHAWTVAEVWTRIRQAGTRSHEAYKLGMPRLSCCFCIFADKDALMLAGQHNRALLDQYVEVERATGHRFKAKLSIESIRDALDAGQVPAAVPDWTM